MNLPVLANPPLIHPVILCGGAGTRLWPASRRNQPKQFAMEFDGLSLFQHAVTLVDAPGFAKLEVITGEDQKYRIIEQMARIDRIPGVVLVEPEARNTAPAVLAAALHIAQTDADGVLLVLPSDHRVSDQPGFRAAVAAALPRALAGDLVTFGINPSRAETGYGYLELSDPAGLAATLPQPLVRFVEKPDAARARAMFEGGCHLWNAGIFLMSVKSAIAAFAMHAPEIHAAVSTAVAAAQTELPFITLDKAGWATAPSISVDYAIMEKAANLAVMPYHGYWSDLGDWSSVWRDGDPDDHGNVLAGDSLAYGCRTSILHSEVKDQMIVGLDLDDMIVVATADAILVAPQTSSQKVGEVVKELRQIERPEGVRARHDHRPWGWYDSIAVRNGFQVKHIMVAPHQALSLQSHERRSEHWIILSGQASVTVGTTVRQMGRGDYVFIPTGAVHRLENHGAAAVLMVEVQVGDYLGEDDIVRYADRYARAKSG